MQIVKPRLHQGCCRQHVAACCRQKLLPVCCPSVAGYKGIQCRRDTGNMLPATSNMLPGNMLLVARPRNMLPGNMLP